MIFQENIVEKYTLPRQELEKEAIDLFKNYLSKHKGRFLSSLQKYDYEDLGITTVDNLKDALVEADAYVKDTDEKHFEAICFYFQRKNNNNLTTMRIDDIMAEFFPETLKK